MPMRPAGRPRGGGSVWSWVVVVAVIGVSVGSALTLWLLSPEEPEKISDPVTITEVPVAIETYDGSRPASIIASLTPGPSVRASTGGRVTASACVPEGSVESGDVVVSLDGRPLVGLATATPLWRDLSVGANGEDVAALQTELQRLGFEVSPTGVYDAETQAAVRAFNNAAGLRDNGRLDVASVVWLSEPEFRTESCNVALGDLVTQWDVLAMGPADLGQTRIEADLPESLVANGWSFQTDGTTIRLDQNLEPVDDEAWGLLRDLVTAAGATGEPTRIDGTIALTAPIQALVLPPAAVHPGTGDSAACFYLVENGQRIEATILDSALGRTILTSPISVPAGTAVTFPRSEPC